jgi:hypothetical protein
MYFTNISLIFFRSQWFDWHRREVPLASKPTSSPVSPFTITTRGSQESLSLTFTMFLRLSHRSLYYTIFIVCRHLGSDPDLPDAIWKGDHPGTIVTKLDSSWLDGFRKEDLWKCFSKGFNVNFADMLGCT